MEKLIELIKSLFGKGSVVEKIKVVKQLDKEVKNLNPINKPHIKKKKK